MEFKGTPAPWYVTNRTDLSEPYGIIKSGEKFIAYTITKGVGRKQEDANALLIAAAPELLEALQKLLKYHDDFYGIEPDEDPEHPLSVANLAIAKALGQQ